MTQFPIVTVLVAALSCASRVYAQDDDHARQVAQERRQAESEAPQLAELLGIGPGVTVEGGAASTNLPYECCEALFLRYVYHHITEPAAFNKSLYATAKPGGRLAIIDAPPGNGSELPSGVPANRGGPRVAAPVVIEEITTSGVVHQRTK